MLPSLPVVYTFHSFLGCKPRNCLLFKILSHTLRKKLEWFLKEGERDSALD